MGQCNKYSRDEIVMSFFVFDISSAKGGGCSLGILRGQRLKLSQTRSGLSLSFDLGEFKTVYLNKYFGADDNKTITSWSQSTVGNGF
ncbi:unnamed protein product [Calypogeia fissa]